MMINGQVRNHMQMIVLTGPIALQLGQSTHFAIVLLAWLSVLSYIWPKPVIIFFFRVAVGRWLRTPSVLHMAKTGDHLLPALCCSGMLAKDTICAEMAFMLMERNRPGSTIDYPMGGTKAIVDALKRGIEKHGGKIMLRSHVDEIIVEGKQTNTSTVFIF